LNNKPAAFICEIPELMCLCRQTDFFC